MFQYVNPSNSDARYSLRSTQYADYARISNFDNVTGLTVVSGTTGFGENNSIYGSPISNTPAAYNPSFQNMATIANDEGTLNYSLNFTCSQVSTSTNGTSGKNTTNSTSTGNSTDNNDDLSTGEIVGKHTSIYFKLSILAIL